MTTTAPTLQPMTLSEPKEIKPAQPQLQPIQGLQSQLSAPQQDVSQFAAEARKLGLSEFEATRQVLGRDIEKQAEALNRELYGKNVSLQAGLGTQKVQDVMTKRSRELEPVAEQIASRTAQSALNQLFSARQEDRATQANNAKTILDLASKGQITLTPEIKDKLVAQGIPITQLKTTNEIEMENRYGRKADGNAWGSESEAAEYWKGQGFNADMVRKYGTNADTGKPFVSEQEAQDFFQKKGFDVQLLQKYGIGPDGKPFTNVAEAELYNNKKIVAEDLAARYGQEQIGTDDAGKSIYKAFESEQAAKNYWETKKLDNVYGKDANGNSFTNEKQATEYWVDKGYKKDIIQKYGINKTGKPFETKDQALAYWKAQGFDADLLASYGINPMEGIPFTSESEAIKVTEEKRLKDRLDQAKVPENLAKEINTNDELDFYLEKGQTYEGYVADAVQNAKTLDEWKAKLPNLELLFGKLRDQWETENNKPGGWLDFAGRDDRTISKLEMQGVALKEMIASIKGGVSPVVDEVNTEKLYEEYGLKPKTDSI